MWEWANPIVQLISIFLSKAISVGLKFFIHETVQLTKKNDYIIYS